jgi:hypothetical protein
MLRLETRDRGWLFCLALPSSFRLPAVSHDYEAAPMHAMLLQMDADGVTAADFEGRHPRLNEAE